jgi:integrase
MADSSLQSKRKLHRPVPGHPGIYWSERAGGRKVYEYRTTDSTGRRVLLVAGPRLTDAKRKLTEAQHLKNTEGFIHATTTLAEVYEDWKRIRDIRPGSERTFDLQWKSHIEPVIGKRKVRDIDDLSIERFLRGLKRKDGREGDLSSSTKRLILSTLEIVLKHAVRMHLISTVPKLPRGSKPKPSEPRKRILSHEEERNLLACCGPVPWMKPIITVALHEALRLGEVAALHWEDVDFVAGTMKISRSLSGATELGPPKGGKRSTIPLTPAAREALLDLRLDSGGTAFVFRNTLGGPRKIRDIQRAFKKATERAGLDGVCFHTLRHTGISRCANSAEIPMIQVQRFARHSNMTTTLSYCHVIEDETVNVAIGAALTGSAA